VILVRPSLVCIVDELESPHPAQFQWLMHASSKLQLDQNSQTLVSQRGDAQMHVRLITPSGFTFSQTNEWPLAPKTGYPTARKPEPERLWHFTASTRQSATARRIVAVMDVTATGESPNFDVQVDESNVRVQSRTSATEKLVEIDLATAGPSDAALIRVRSVGDDGDVATWSAR
jgi:hypothetical protein